MTRYAEEPCDVAGVCFDMGLTGFDVVTGSRSCDRSCSDSLNGAPKEAPTATSLSPPDLVG